MAQYIRQYESIIIINSSLHEDTLNRIVARSEEIITKSDGKIIEIERWGKRRLAYPIKKFQYGFYIIFHFEASSTLVEELEHEYGLNENILRFMTLVKDKPAISAYNKRKEEQVARAELAATAAEEKANADSAITEEAPVVEAESTEAPAVEAEVKEETPVVEAETTETPVAEAEVTEVPAVKEKAEETTEPATEEDSEKAE